MKLKSLGDERRLSEFTTLADVAEVVGSYAIAFSMGASGQLGRPVRVGRMQLYPYATAEVAVRRRLADRGAACSAEAR